MTTATESLHDNIQYLLNTNDASIAEHVACLARVQQADEATPAERLALLKKTLQQAVLLEFATLPPYLCALWSIKDNLHPVAKSIRNVVQEEMLHMALACNMLASLGGQPRIYDTGRDGLRYPSALPGGVHPELHIGLAGLSDDVLDDFMEIELPEKPMPIGPYDSKYRHAHDHDGSHATTIGALYDAILNEFLQLQPKMTPDRQVAGPLSWFIVDTPEKVDSAIHWIKTQGEGAVEQAPSATGLKSLSHYYRFWEVRMRRKIEFDAETGKYVFGAPLAFPDVWPMAPTPDGGYRSADASQEVGDLLDGFDRTYSRAIHLLESAWGEGGQAAMWRAIELMFELEKYARPLMAIPLPGGGGNYGPCFRLVPYS
jgi:hypothetical protein